MVWTAAAAAAGGSAVSIAILASRGTRPAERWLSLFAQDLPRSVNAEILLVGPEQSAAGDAPPPAGYQTVAVPGDPSEFDLLDAAIRAARNEAVVVLDAGANPVA